MHYPHFVLDFDHRPGEIKTRSVSEMLKNNASDEDIASEISKCDLVCANCHRFRTAQRIGIWNGLTTQS